MKLFGSIVLGISATVAATLVAGNAHATPLEIGTTGLIGFEGTDSYDSSWTFGTDTGEDFNRGNAYQGENNLWVVDTSGWHSVSLLNFHENSGVVGGGAYSASYCDITAYIRCSSGVGNGVYMEAYDAVTGTELISEHGVCSGDESEGETYEAVDSGLFNVVVSGYDNTLDIDFGLEGQGTQQWFQLDNVTVTCYAD